MNYNNANDTVTINKKHKDRLFTLIFGSEKNKLNLLSLYNAINNTNYENLDDLEITTIEDAIYMGMKNDVSLLMVDSLSLYEHQSTYNPNMPVRGFMYFGKLYSKYIKENKLNLYGKKQLLLPTPQYIVFYNGSAMTEDVQKLRLSDSFKDNTIKNEFEWTATVLNINYGHNNELMDKCIILRDYAVLVDKIKYYTRENNDLRQAVEQAVTECISQGILKEILIEHRAEVIDVCITEYDEEEVMTAIRKECFDEGMEHGRKQMINLLVCNGILEPDKAAEILGITINELEKIIKEMDIE